MLFRPGRKPRRDCMRRFWRSIKKTKADVKSKIYKNLIMKRIRCVYFRVKANSYLLSIFAAVCAGWKQPVVARKESCETELRHEPFWGSCRSFLVLGCKSML